MRYISGRARTPLETASRLTAHLQQHEQFGFGLYATFDRASGRFVGRCGLEPRPDLPQELTSPPTKAGTDGALSQRPAGELAWMFAFDCWGQGLGLEAGRALLEFGLAKLRLPRVFATADHANHASIAIMQRLNMLLVAETDRGVEYEIRQDGSPE